MDNINFIMINFIINIIINHIKVPMVRLILISHFVLIKHIINY